MLLDYSQLHYFAGTILVFPYSNPLRNRDCDLTLNPVVGICHQSRLLFGVAHLLAFLLAFVNFSAGFEELGHYFRPKGLPRAQQPWLASIWRKQQ